MLYPKKSVILLFLLSPIYVFSQGLVVGNNISFTINSGIVLSINDGDFLLKSDSSGTGTLLNNNTAGNVNISGTAIVERYVLRGTSTPFGTGLWHYVSSPVSNQAIDMDFVVNNDVSQEEGRYDFYLWEEQNNIWRKFGGPTFTDPEFVPGKGYAIIFNSDASRVFIGTAGTKLNDGNVSITVHKNDGNYYGGFNLLGNPYPSPISNADFVAYNSSSIEGTIYYWSQKPDWEQGVDNYAYWNVAGTVGNGFQEPEDFTAIGQAFMVMAIADNQQVTFTNAMRSTGDPVFLKNQLAIPRIWLRVSDMNENLNETLIAFPEDGTAGFDIAYDARKLSGSGLLLSTRCIGNSDLNLAIQGLPPITEQPVTILLELSAPSAGSHEISLKKLDYWNLNHTIILEDLLANQFSDLLKCSYSFQVSEPGIQSGRFLLHLNAKPQTVHVNSSSLFIYSYNDAIYLKNNLYQSLEGELELYNMLGQLVYNKRVVLSGLVKYKPNCISGYYIARFIHADFVISTKLLIK
jgi:hypothetical protein